MRDVYVIGIGQTVFGKQDELHINDLGATAALAAIRDAEISPKDLEVAYCGINGYKGTPVQSMLQRLGVSRIRMYNVENACSSGSSAVDLLHREVALGAVEVGIAVGVESLSMLNKQRAGGKGLLAMDDQQGRLALTMPHFFASEMAQQLMEKRGATMQDICAASVKNHKVSKFNPYAQYKKELTFEQIMASPMIADPITMLQCCPQSDGGASIILCSEAYYNKNCKKTHRPRVKMAASVILTSGPEDSDSDPLALPVLVNAAKKACEIAGVDPLKDINVVELHDAFSAEELAAYEMIGICKKGDGVAFSRSGDSAFGGRCPVNLSGGLLSLGHPLGASGLRVCNNVTQQLWGEAGDVQVKNAKVGMAEMLGGVLTGQENPVVAGIQIMMR